ncbi:hypothetical protein ACIGO8_25485 [Streptomyces sp. NPDC053493]|uniref:hypothetical protein n=1 Tax=Streptomyces sp. NPDC053493 TaxID=3365705 RepID=UPI0037CF89F6
MTAAAIDTAQTPKALLTGALTYTSDSVMQSFAVDSTAQELYTLQVVPADVYLTGDKEPIPGGVREDRGDLLCTRLALATGQVLDRMYLRGFGHGTSFGVVPRAGGGVDLWLEGNALHHADRDITEGQAIAVTRYVPATGDGRTKDTPATAVDCGDTNRVEVLNVPGFPQHCLTAVDPAHHRLVVATRGPVPPGQDNQHYVYRYALYALDQAAEGVLAEVPGVRAVTHVQPYPQGMATFGDHLYLWTGDAWADDATLTTFDWRTGLSVRRTRIRRTAADPARREPEGLAPWAPEPGAGDDRTRLCFAFTFGPPSSARRSFDLMYLPGPGEPDLTVEVLVDWTPITLAAGVRSGSAEVPQARLIALAGNRLLQLRGKITCGFSDAATGGLVGALPAALRPSLNLHAGCPRNARDGFAVCRVEANDDGNLYAYGATPDNTVDWIQLDNFSVPWA